MTNFQKFALAFIVVVGFFLIGGFAYKIGDKQGYKRGYNAIHPADTVWRDTTIVKDSLIEVVKWKEKDKLVYVPVKVDSLIHDTTYVALEREYKMYADSTFEAQVSGIDPTLDWIKIHQKTAYITNTVVQKEPYDWYLGVFGEGHYMNNRVGIAVGAIYEKQFLKDFSYYIKVGYDYNTMDHTWFGAAGVRIMFSHD